MIRSARSTNDRHSRRWQRFLRRVLSDRDRRALYLGFVSISILIVLSRGVPLWIAWTGTMRSDARAATEELSRATAMVHARSALADSLSERGNRLISVMPAFLTGASPEAAGASLAGILSQAAGDSRVELSSMEVRADSLGSGEATRVSVRAVVSGDVNGVMQMLAAIEGDQRLLAVRSLRLDQPEPDAPPSTMERLQVTMVVEGLLLTPRMEKGS